MNKSKGPKVYWERQQGDLMCGMHAINSLLQAPYFDEVSLSQVALQLEKKESSLMGKTVKGTHLNDGGYFSLQVLIEALNSKGDFSVTSITSKANQLLKFSYGLCQRLWVLGFLSAVF